MAEEHDRGPVNGGNGGPVVPGAGPPRAGVPAVRGNGANGGGAGVDALAGAPAAASHRTRIGGLWVLVTVFAVVLVFLLIFILQNDQHVNVRFLGLAGAVPSGVALLFAATAGFLLAAIPGYVRILQLRYARRRRQHPDHP